MNNTSIRPIASSWSRQWQESLPRFARPKLSRYSLASVKIKKNFEHSYE